MSARPAAHVILRLAGTALVVVPLALASGIEPAEAGVPQGAVKKLRKAPCPPRYAVRVARTPDRDRLRDARRGVFRIGGKEVRIANRMDWTFDPIGSASFRARLHDLRWLDTLLYAYRSRGNEHALRRARRIVVDWIRNNPRGAPTTDRTWFDKVAGDRAPYIAYVTRAASCERMIRSPRQARLMLGSVRQHLRFLSGPKRYSDTNRGLFMDLGLLFAGRQMRFLPGAGKMRQAGQRRFVRTIERHTHPHEAFWLEHSTTYQFLVINVLGRFLEVTQRKHPALEGLLEGMKETSGWLIEPDDRWLQAGNSYQERAKGFARRAARKARGLRVLERSGLGFARKRQRYLAVLSNFHSSTHKHSDDLSFDLFEHGRRVVADSGMSGKDPGETVDFTNSARAHSTLVVDGLDFPRDGASAYGSGILASGEGDGWFAIEATNPLVGRLGVGHRRLFLYRPGYALIVADRIRSERRHEYRRYLQFGPAWRLRTDRDGIELQGGGDRISVSSSTPGSPGAWRTIRGRKDPLGGFVFTGFRDRTARWTAWVDNQASDLDGVITLGLRANQGASASALDELGNATDSFEIAHDGRPVRTVTVTRSGSRLSVADEKAPATSGGRR